MTHPLVSKNSPGPDSRTTLSNRPSGFTLVELMVVLAIIVVLLLIAVPSYQASTANSRISSEVNELRGDIELARSEALKQGLTVVLCPSTDATNCTANESNWAAGWIVFATDGTCAATSGTVLRIKQAFTSSDTATYTPDIANNSTLCFNRLGFSPADHAGLFAFDTAAANNVFKRCLAVSNVGHAQVLRNSESDISGTAC